MSWESWWLWWSPPPPLWLTWGLWSAWPLGRAWSRPAGISAAQVSVKREWCTKRVLITWIQMVEKSCVIFGDFWSSGIAKNSSLERRCFDSELMHSNHHSQLEPRNFFQDVQQRTSKKSNHQHLLSTAFFDLHQLQGATIRVTTAIESCSVYWSHIGHQLLGPALPLRIHHEGWSRQSIWIYPHPGGVTPQDFVNVNWSYQHSRAPALKRKQILCNKFCFRTIASPRDIEMIFGKMCDV